ncbi:MAG: cobalamin B12-binding domain-containing protein, partial [Candidatus Omnitrophica bacterium]|nr:cobalamin B12-binding domain-containing protein [Candidatus Omnitrophota bacterium]
MAKVVLISPYDQYTLGVRYLSSALKNAGHQTRIIIHRQVHHNRNPESLRVDQGYSGATAACSEVEYQHTKELIKDFDPDFIGISLASQSFGLSAWMTERFRKDFPGIPILWGGADPTLH